MQTILALGYSWAFFSEIFIGNFRAIATVDSVQRNSHVLKTLQRRLPENPPRKPAPTGPVFPIPATTISSDHLRRHADMRRATAILFPLLASMQQL
jgi:hypothetical protein